MHPHSPRMHSPRNGSVMLSAANIWKLPNINRLHDVTMSETAVRLDYVHSFWTKESVTAAFTFLSSLKEKEINTKNTMD